MFPDTYEIENLNANSRFFTPVVETSMLISRLDERASRSELLAGWQERLLFDQAIACQLAEGNLVHMPDLILLDADGRRRSTHVDLLDTLQMLRGWRRAVRGDASELLRKERPGEDRATVDAPSSMLRKPIKLRGIKADRPIAEQPKIDEQAMLRWRRILRLTEALTPVLAAAVVWHAWRQLAPEPGGGWRGSLLAALVLRMRGLAASFLLPIDTGRKTSTYAARPTDTLDDRLLGMVSWMHAAAVRSSKQMNSLILARDGMLVRIAERRSHSRLPALLDLFISRPLVSIPMAAKMLDCSTQAVQKMLPHLGSSPTLMTERGRFRFWRVA